jgi:uncharacterized membrane protein YraQ (UPF0718 family)
VHVSLFFYSLLAIVFQALPFIIVGALVSGILEELLPQGLIPRLLPKNHVLAIALSSLLGMIFPMCECGIVPVMRRLLGKGLPLGCAIAYMLAAPVINPVVIASTWAAYSGNREGLLVTNGMLVVGLRIFMAFLTAVLTGLVVYRLQRKEGIETLLVVPPKPSNADEEVAVNNSKHGSSLFQRLSRISATAVSDIVDITCYLILGAILSAAVQAVAANNRSLELIPNQPYLAIPAMMFLAILLCLCSEADAFVSANMPTTLSATMAFLVLGPMLDMKLYVMFTRVFRTRLILTLLVTLLVTVFSLSMALEYLPLIPQGGSQTP